MNDKHTTIINNLITNLLDCAGIEQFNAIKSNPKPCHDGFYVDICIEDCSCEDLAYFVGFLAENIGMKNIWFDTYPSSKRAHIELNFTQEFLAR